MQRIFLFLVTNLAVLALLTVVIWTARRLMGVRVIARPETAVSTGLLRSMRRSEVEAVLAHEITPVANGDRVTLALLQGVVNTLVIFLARVIGGIVDRTVSGYSRRREFRADRGGANLAGAGGMIGALEALKRSQGEPLPPQMQAFGINTGEAGGFMRLFMSHPPLDARIAALRHGAAQEPL